MLVLGFLLAPSGTAAQERRALLVGIDTYVADAAPSSAPTRGWTNLDGAVNDARALQALLLARFGFAAEHTTLLLNEAATREGILTAIRTRLIAPAEAGDEVVFFYAGHGSQVKNTASTEPDQMDETIVPADSRFGAPDLRDKEMRHLFGELVARGVELTLIYDSCHSGSVTRGLAPGKSRALAPPPTALHAPSSSELPPQAHDGVLVLSAAQDHEVAKEIVDDTGRAHGAFTWALTRTLRTMPPDLPARRLFQRVRALMRAHGVSQEPVIEGRPARRTRALFSGLGPGGHTATQVAALGPAENGQIPLQGGQALGLTPGTELRQHSASETAPTDPDRAVRVRITSVQGLDRSAATVIQGDPAPIRGGEMFEVDRWAASAGTPLRVWIPPALPRSTIAQLRPVFATLQNGGEWVWTTDPTETPPTHTLLWAGATWLLHRPGGPPQSLGPSLRADAVRDALRAAPPPVALFAPLPPTTDLARALDEALDALDRPIAQAPSLATAHYVLAGTSLEDRPAYYWFYRPAAEGSSRAMPPRITRMVPASDANRTGALLADFVHRIDRSWGWLQLESPPDAAPFPYILAGFEEAATGTFVGPTDTLRWNTHYRLVLEATPEALRAARRSFDPGLTERYFYVFAIDIEGNGTLLYGSGNSENSFDFTDAVPDPPRVVLPYSGRSLFQSWPTREGALAREVDTFVLLTTSAPLSDPTILNFVGVRSRGAETPPESPLERALFSIAHGARDAHPTVPSAWSIQRLPMISTQ